MVSNNQTPFIMKNISDLLKTIAEFITTNPTVQKIQNLITVITLYLGGEIDELTEFIKTKFFYGSNLIDENIIITPYNGPETTNTELLNVFVKKAREKGYKMAYNNDGTGYDDDISNWGFLDEEVSETSPPMYIPILPKGGLTESQMLTEAKTADKEHEHLVCDAIRTAISILDADFYKEKGTWTLFFLKNKRKSDEMACRLDFGFYDDGKFYVCVDSVNEAREWDRPRVGLPLCNKTLKV